MQLINFNIDKIIIHQIFQRNQDGDMVEPTQGHEFIKFDKNAMETFKTRIKDALGDGSKAVKMEIVNQDPDDLPSIIDTMMDQDADAFAASSYDVAKALAKAQIIKSTPGGIVVVFSGKQGHPKKNFCGIMKAEVHNGYEKEVNKMTNEISLKFVEELLLTPGTRLYKTAGFFENALIDDTSSDLNKKWTVMVSDYQINKVDGKVAAKYFYSSFLGCGYPKTSARTTKQFYESSSKFFKSLDVPEAKKSDLLNALTTYLKVDTSSSISASEFASKYIDDIDTQDAFTEFIKESGIPDNAFTKDIEHIKSKLKFRKINFSSKVKITAPSETFKELIIIEPIEGDLDESGNPTEWTRVTIKDRITTQE
jgi:hypothetical protein